MALVLMYLAAVVLANLSVLYFGPISTPFNAFFLIALDLTSRDALHERWHGRYLWGKMLALITLGGFISWVLNRGVARIAIASFIAFAAAGLADTIVYQLFYSRSKMVKVNYSNVVSSAVDSILFPTIAFGAFIWWAVLGQFVAKVFGGYMWALILKHTLWSNKTAGV